MAFLDDFQDAVTLYPTTNVTVTIPPGEIRPVGPTTPGAFNVNEVWSFRVRVRNNGNLNMTGVSLRVAGQNGAQVSTAAAGPWSASFSFGNLTLGGHGGQQDTVNLYFKAPNAARPAGTDLVTSNINGFDVDLNHILINHSNSSATPVGTLAGQVFP